MRVEDVFVKRWVKGCVREEVGKLVAWCHDWISGLKSIHELNAVESVSYVQTRHYRAP